jgi:hypothetical protein
MTSSLRFDFLFMRISDQAVQWDEFVIVVDACGRMKNLAAEDNARVCSDCRSLPKGELQRNPAMREILGFLEQSNIS